MRELTRRQFVRRSAAAGAALQALATAGAAMAQDAAEKAKDAAKPATTRDGEVELRWLEGDPPYFMGATWGVPWPRGMVKRDSTFALRDAGGGALSIQSWPLAHWPDGSVKWSAHALAGDAAPTGAMIVSVGDAAASKQPIRVEETADSIDIDTGVIRCSIAKRGDVLIRSMTRQGRETMRNAHLVLLRQDQPDLSGATPLRQDEFVGEIEAAVLEQNGPVRSVVRLDGKHRGGERRWLPFTIRLYFYASAQSVRIMHTFIFDGDENKDFIRGLGLRFDVPLSDSLHDRQVRFAGEGDGLWAEGVRNLTGLRRDPGRAVIDAQLSGKPCPPVSQWPETVSKRLELIPACGDYTQSQLSPDSFEIRKRTKEGHCWLHAADGHRAAGAAYIGGANAGGVAFGVRDFWQRYPTQLDIRGATTDAAHVTIWLWSPSAPAMDLRSYHDGLGMDTHAKQIEGLEITYEDYEPGFATAHGIARTSEMFIAALSATPSRDQFVQFARAVQQPPQIVCDPKHYLAAGVFGRLWTTVDRSTPAKKRIEDELDFLIGFYQKQIEQRRWYGFWNYGDVMHTYDRDRHEWRYDVGGYAWANSELSPDLWLWYSFLRTGRADIFRMSEAMTRHTGEVDVYHLGRFAKLGSRHNVLHWGCSAKQLRISTAIYRRFYYFLTADERVGDLMRELIDADETFVALDPIRKIRTEPFTPQPHALGVGFGTDWGSLAAAWFAEWERSGDEKVRQKLTSGMKTIGAMPRGFFTEGATYDLQSGAFAAHGDRVGVSHLSAVFGLPEICAELLENFDVPEFEKAWVQYCELYSAPPQQQESALGTRLRGTSLMTAHSRLTAYAAWKRKDAQLAARAWKEFAGERGPREPARATRVKGPAVLNDVDEAAGVSTNDASQWSLAAMQNLALVGDALP